MDLKKTAQHVEVVKKSLQSSVLPEKKAIKSSLKHNMEPVRWYCQDCCLVLTSQMQAQEHFLGKKHQNVLKNKAANIKYSDARVGFNGQCAVNGVLPRDKLQDACYSRKPSIDHCWESKYGINDVLDIIPPPAGRDNILETVIKSEKRTVSTSDLSIYRTPSALGEQETQAQGQQGFLQNQVTPGAARSRLIIS